MTLLTDEIKRTIDDMSYEELLTAWLLDEFIDEGED